MRLLGLLLLGAIGHVLVGLAWLWCSDVGPPVWIDGAAQPLASAGSHSGHGEAWLAVRPRAELGFLGRPAAAERMLVLSVSEVQSHRSETWAVTTLGPDVDAALAGLVWLDERRLALTVGGRPRAVFTLASPETP